jgi:hypothetical protein
MVRFSEINKLNPITLSIIFIYKYISGSYALAKYSGFTDADVIALLLEEVVAILWC